VKSTEPHILVLTSWSSDEPLIQSYVLPYLKLISDIHHGNVRFSLQTWEKLSAQSIRSKADLESKLRTLNGALLSMHQHNFGWRAMASQLLNFVRLLWKIWAKRVTVIHCFAPPAAVMGLLLKYLTRTKLVVDSWEPHAEAMVETGSWRRSSLAFRILYSVERRLVKRADVLIATSHKMIDYARARWGEPIGLVLFRPACVDMNLFDPRRFNRVEVRNSMGIDEEAVVGICVSKFGGLYLEEESFQFFAAAERTFGSKFKMLILSANKRDDVSNWARRAGLSERAFVHAKVPFQDVPKWLAGADFAFNPQKPVPSKKYGTPVKDGEYWAMGLPLVILPDISDDSEIVEKELAGIVMNSFAPGDMAEALRRLYDLLESDPAPSRHIRSLAAKYRSFDIATEAYRKAYPI